MQSSHFLRLSVPQKGSINCTPTTVQCTLTTAESKFSFRQNLLDPTTMGRALPLCSCKVLSMQSSLFRFYKSCVLDILYYSCFVMFLFASK